ncbi:MAG: NTP transferase domain-containing protein [Planctomycetota bacterium]
MQSAGTVVVLAAGQGTRMRSALPKVLHEVCGRPLLGWVLDQARALDPERIVVVTGHAEAAVREYVEQFESDPRITFAHQSVQYGTGHAVEVALANFRGVGGSCVVLYGDMPLVRAESLVRLVGQLKAARAAATTAIVDQPRGFGRILRSDDGAFRGIVEERDASPKQRSIREVNVGVYAFLVEDLELLLPELERNNAQGELYLTDVLTRIAERGDTIATVELEDPSDAIGINTLAHLAEARTAIQMRILEQHLENGVKIIDPATTYIDHGVTIGAGTEILPCTVIRGDVVIGERCEVGPFTHLRAGTRLADGAEIGNFCEAKKAVVGPGTKAKHLTYLGDVTIGAKANIGAGTIVANYDGTHKHLTTIGDRAFVGSGSVLIAPCAVGDDALTGGGAVVTRNASIPPGEAWVGVPARPLPKKR